VSTTSDAEVRDFPYGTVIDAARRITGCAIEEAIAPRRTGDPAVLVASSERIHNDLGWSPIHSRLDDIIASAWDWMRWRGE